MYERWDRTARTNPHQRRPLTQWPKEASPVELVSFESAYLRTHYPAESLAAVISDQGDTQCLFLLSRMLGVGAHFALHQGVTTYCG
ncbi:MAG: hypothetical protein ACXW39_07685 [Nitrospira sp.]